MHYPLIQVAGIRDCREARMLLAAGVDLLGFPLFLDYHRQDLSPETAATIIKNLQLSDRAVLITYLDRAVDILRLVERLGVQWVQLHGEITQAELQQVRSVRPALNIAKSLIVRDNNLAGLKQTISELAPLVSAFIMDTFDPETGASGATGIVHNWLISRDLVAHSPRPVILAGGLNPDNVREAILTVRPVEVDVHTGVEDSCGRKRRYLVSAFVAAALEAFQDLQTSDDQIQSARELLQVPITDTLDLHTFKPREVSDLLPEYIRCCLLAGYSQLRIIHGKGTGILRNRVHHILKEQPEVVSFSLADVSGGSWGATIVYLKQSNQITK